MNKILIAMVWFRKGGLSRGGGCYPNLNDELVSLPQMLIMLGIKTAGKHCLQVVSFNVFWC